MPFAANSRQFVSWGMSFRTSPSSWQAQNTPGFEGMEWWQNYFPMHSARDTRALLREAGCPTEPEQIGISRERLRASYEQAYYIRRRYTVLDFAMRLGVMDAALDWLFGPAGFWGEGVRG